MACEIKELLQKVKQTERELIAAKVDYIIKTLEAMKTEPELAESCRKYIDSVYAKTIWINNHQFE